MLWPQLGPGELVIPLGNMSSTDGGGPLPVMVYKKNLWPLVVLLAGIMCWTSVRFRSSPLLIFFLLAVQVALGVMPVALQWRRKIILTETEIVSIPGSGPPVRIKIDEVKGMEDTKTQWSPGRYESEIPALRFRMATGAAVVVPLDFRNRDEIRQAITALVGKNSGGK
jgi:hypothetical protein